MIDPSAASQIVNAMLFYQHQRGFSYREGAHEALMSAVAEGGNKAEIADRMEAVLKDYEVGPRFPWYGGRTLRSVLKGGPA